MEDDFVKITNAVYKVLDYFPSDDPLKNKAKEKALLILENLTLISSIKEQIPTDPNLKKNYYAVIKKASDQVFVDIEILENYLAIAKFQGWIDVANFLIIKTQYQKIKNNIAIFLPSQVLLSGQAVTEKNFDQKENNVLEVKKTIDVAPQNQILIVGNQLPSKPFEQYPPSEKALHRQTKILTILDRNKKAQVADFIKELPDVTKRTIRRDLNDLLFDKKIVRIGEWNQVFYEKA